MNFTVHLGLAKGLVAAGVLAAFPALLKPQRSSMI